MTPYFFVRSSPFFSLARSPARKFSQQMRRFQFNYDFHKSLSIQCIYSVNHVWATNSFFLCLARILCVLCLNVRVHGASIYLQLHLIASCIRFHFDFCRCGGNLVQSQHLQYHTECVCVCVWMEYLWRRNLSMYCTWCWSMANRPVQVFTECEIFEGHIAWLVQRLKATSQKRSIKTASIWRHM